MYGEGGGGLERKGGGVCREEGGEGWIKVRGPEAPEPVTMTLFITKPIIAELSHCPLRTSRSD